MSRRLRKKVESAPEPTLKKDGEAEEDEDGTIILLHTTRFRKPGEELPRKYHDHGMMEVDSTVGAQELEILVRDSFSLPSGQPIKLKWDYQTKGSTKVSCPLSQESLEDAFRAYKTDPSMKLGIIIEYQIWPEFTTAFHFRGQILPKHIHELEMMRLSSKIRRIPNWYEKMKDKKVISTWMEEAKAEGRTKQQVAYVLKELKYYASRRQSEYQLEISDIDHVYHSDTMIGDSLGQQIKSQLLELENCSKLDWHPGTNNTVWDLVHPSLHPIVYGKTRCMLKAEIAIPPIKYCGHRGRVMPRPQQGFFRNYNLSTNFAWLPSEFMIHADGTIRIDSYINNLHPERHVKLYRTIEMIFAKFVPLFENVLSDFLRENRVPYDEDGGTKPKPIPAFKAPPSSERISLLGNAVQVFVKITNTILTPRNPTFPGESWEAEELENEEIVATGIYFVEVENISEETELGFRVETIGVTSRFTEYELSAQDQYNQILGSVKIQQNRCIGFPNLFQHRIPPFSLADPTKPGHLKIISFCLVNPGVRLRSTLTVPPQQQDWYLEEIYKIPAFAASLPQEMVQHIGKFLKWPPSFDQAKEWRDELIAERESIIDAMHRELGPLRRRTWDHVPYLGWEDENGNSDEGENDPDPDPDSEDED